MIKTKQSKPNYYYKANVFTDIKKIEKCPRIVHSPMSEAETAKKMVSDCKAISEQLDILWHSEVFTLENTYTFTTAT